MYGHAALAASVILAALTQHATAVDKTKDPDLIAKLITANSQLDRLALLPSDDDWHFDFTVQQPNYNFAPGGVVNMNSATFPAAKGNGMTCESRRVPSGDARPFSSLHGWAADTNSSGDVEPRTLLDAASALPPAGHQLRRCSRG